MNPFAHQRRDANEPEVIESLRNAGYVIIAACAPAVGKHGAGAPDLLIWSGRGRRIHAIEVKNPKTHARKAGGSKATEAQERLMRVVEHEGIPYHVVNTGFEAVAMVRAYDDAWQA